MTRKRPQNGPSLSKAPYKKPKPLTDEELAQVQARQAEREAELRKKADDGRRFSKAVRARGGSIPVRGSGAAEFFAELRDDPEQSKRFIETAKEIEASEKKEDANRAFRKVSRPAREQGSGSTDRSSRSGPKEP
jgi:hypothetical protein